jgi:hypothetical protein
VLGGCCGPYAALAMGASSGSLDERIQGMMPAAGSAARQATL